MNMITALGCTPAAAVRGYLLEALAASDCYALVAVEGLSSDCLLVRECDVMIATTSAATPMFRGAVEQIATARREDVLLLRVGDPEDGLLRVEVDLTLAALPGIWVENGLRIWTDYATRWLVPEAFGPSVLVSSDGLHLELVPPYATLAQRDAGIARAEHEMARLAVPAGVR